MSYPSSIYLKWVVKFKQIVCVCVFGGWGGLVKLLAAKTDT